VTAEVVMVNFAVFCPAGTRTEAGTLAAVPLDERAMLIPPTGAAVPSVTVPVEGFPPTTETGLTDRLSKAGGLIVNVAVFAVPTEVAVIVATV